MWVQAGLDLRGDVPDDPDDLFGYSVDVSGDGRVIAIGAPLHTLVEVDAGLVRVFELDEED